MSTSKPGPKTWVLRCKIHKTMILLYVESNTTLAALKTELQKALNDTAANNEVQTVRGLEQIPTSLDDIILGQLVDPNNPQGEWKRIEADYSDVEDSEKSKGKKVVGKAQLQNGVSKATVQSVGLSDGSLVGVRFRDSRPANPDSIDWDIVPLKIDADEQGDTEVDEEAMSDSAIPVPASTNYDRVFNT